MKNIIFETKHKEGIRGLYHGQPYKIDFKTKSDLLEVLSDDEVEEVLKEYDTEVVNPSFMLGIEIGSFVKVNIFEGGDIFEYELEVTSIEEQGYDDEGNYFCVAYGEGLTDADKELAEEFTHRIDSSNFASILI